MRHVADSKGDENSFWRRFVLHLRQIFPITLLFYNSAINNTCAIDTRCLLSFDVREQFLKQKTLQLHFRAHQLCRFSRDDFSCGTLINHFCYSSLLKPNYKLVLK